MSDWDYELNRHQRGYGWEWVKLRKRISRQCDLALAGSAETTHIAALLAKVAVLFFLEWHEQFLTSCKHSKILRAETGLSLRPQTKLGNLTKADTQGRDPVFSMCKRSERQV